MESFKVLIAFALLVACAYAAQIPEPQQLVPKPEGPLGPGPLPSNSPLEAGPAREKKQALFPYAYAAYPYGGYAAYPYAAAAYPAYSYSYQYLDDGKYYPGKYDGKAYVRASPYYYNPYYYY